MAPGRGKTMLKYIVPEYKRLRVIVDTDAACEADDPFAIAHALMCRKFDVKAISAEQFGGPETVKRRGHHLHIRSRQTENQGVYFHRSEVHS